MDMGTGIVRKIMPYARTSEKILRLYGNEEKIENVGSQQITVNSGSKILYYIAEIYIH